ncbi:hypothetical protein ACIRYZ_00155 [Kitasatospora sp. NPDC101155]|uniref:hypothetical protein n=1 Tax=Kitasatospora sp. NPDC101155 TaxID=3364097 RepID=UPI0037FC8D6E
MSSSLRAKTVVAAVAVAALSAGCTSSAKAPAAARSASASTAGGSSGARGPQPAQQFTVPAPTCKPPAGGAPGDTDCTSSTLFMVQNSVTTWSYQENPEGESSGHTLTSGEEKRGRGPGLEYRIAHCADGTPMAAIMGLLMRAASQVDSPPATLAECATRTPAMPYTKLSTPMPVTDLIGKKLCGSDDPDNNAYYFAIEAAGPPNANGAPDLRITFVAYGTPSTDD